MPLPPDYSPGPDVHPSIRALLEIAPPAEEESPLARAIRERTEPDRLRLMESVGATKGEPDIAGEWRERCAALGLDASVWAERGR